MPFPQVATFQPVTIASSLRQVSTEIATLWRVRFFIRSFPALDTYMGDWSDASRDVLSFIDRFLLCWYRSADTTSGTLQVTSKSAYCWMLAESTTRRKIELQLFGRKYDNLNDAGDRRKEMCLKLPVIVLTMDTNQQYSGPLTGFCIKQ